LHLPVTPFGAQMTDQQPARPDAHAAIAAETYRRSRGLWRVRGLPEDLAVTTAWPRPKQGFNLVGTVLGGEARAALGLPDGPITLDGLVSLWQVDATP